MQLIYGEELDLEHMTLAEIHQLEKSAGIQFVFDGSQPAAIMIPSELPGMMQILKL